MNSLALAFVRGQGLVNGPARRLLALESEPARGVALRIHVDQQRRVSGEGKGGREVDGRGRLTDPAFLVGDRYHLSLQRLM